MAFGISEFPSTNTYDSDLQEMIRLYREMSQKYDKFVETVADLEEKWNQLDGKIDAAVAEGVENATRDIIAEVNGIIEVLENRVDAQLAESDNKVRELENYVTTTAKTLNERMDGLNAAVDNALKIINDAIAETDTKIETEIAKYDEEIRTQIANMTNGLWEQIYILNDKLEHITEQYPPVVNPITGLRQPIDEVLQEMWYWMRIYGITALEYDSLGLTAKEYDDLGLTAIEYDYFAKLHLLDWFNNKMVNPVTGENATVKESIYSVDRNTAIYGCTALLYDNMEISAQQFDAQQLTAYMYDYFAAGFLSQTAPEHWAFKIAPHTYQYAQSVRLTVENDALIGDLPMLAPYLINDNGVKQGAIFDRIISHSNTLTTNDGATSIDLPSLIDGFDIYPTGYKTFDGFKSYVKQRLETGDIDGEWLITINYVFVVQ